MQTEQLKFSKSLVIEIKIKVIHNLLSATRRKGLKLIKMESPVSQ